MEFLKLLCNLYIIALTAVLPLYTGGSYSQLGDSKYILFRNLSFLCLGLWLAASLAERLSGRRTEPAGPEAEDKTSGSGEPRFGGKLPGFSSMDICMLLYGGGVLLSACFSRYGETAWLGYTEWYMGAISQLLFVGIYFFVSRRFGGEGYPLYGWIAAFFLVTVLGILHRFGLDPSGLMDPFNSGDWEYSHMLSTIGNINWFCGYYSVALAVPLGGYLKADKPWKRGLLYPVSLAGLFLLFIQGSDMGLVILAAGLLACLIWGIREAAVFRRTLALTGGLFFLIPAYGALGTSMGQEVIKALPADSIGWNVMNLRVWVPAGAACLLLWLFLRRLEGHGTEKLRRNLRLGLTGTLLAAAAAGAILVLADFSPDEMWGSGRGALWRLSVRGFLRSSPMQKLVGAGPDCFAEYIYTVFSGEELSFLTGRWAGAIFANAHNEWLNHLINLGIMGTSCYLAIFVCGIRRYRRLLPGILALVMYGVASLTGFQQCLSTPLLFLMLGICENRIRGEKQHEMGKVQN